MAVRGSGALNGRARIIWTVDTYNRKLDKREAAVSETDAWKWLRLDIAKGNTLPKGEMKPLWFCLQGMRLSCHREGDSVGVAMRDTPPATTAAEVDAEGILLRATYDIMENLQTDKIAAKTLARYIVDSDDMRPHFEEDGVFEGANPDGIRMRLCRLLKGGKQLYDKAFWYDGAIKRKSEDSKEE